MKSVHCWCLSLCLLSLAACPPEPEAAMQVLLKVATGAQSQFAVVSAGGKATLCLKLANAPLEIGVSQGTMPDLIVVEATGFADAACTVAVSPPEHVTNATATFKRGLVTHVELTLPSSRTEANCADGRDDDLDGKTDCADDDCDHQHCSSGQVCTENEVCTGHACGQGTTVQCNSPPMCFAHVTDCAAPLGCTYKPTANVACTTGNQCFHDEACNQGGDCVGQPVSCTTPPGPQCWKTQGSCSPDAGCSYQPADAGSACDDQNACTSNDSCDGVAGCTGAPVTCEVRACQASRGCDRDAGCQYDLLDAGTTCGDAGVCNVQGGCMPAFPYQPSNVSLQQVPTFPDAGTVLGCGETTVNSGAPGTPPTFGNWCGAPPPWAVVTLDGGTEALVLSASALTLQAPSSLTLTGARPVIVVVNGPVTLLGTVVTRAGAQGCVGDGAGGDANASGNGAGAGGSFGSLGGPGGTGSVPLANNGGGAVGTLAGEPTLVPLRGGCPGGRGQARAVPGGGALQISAAGVVSVAGVVNAPGSGGTAGKAGFGGAEGGGSGGAVLFEGLSITVSGAGAVVANGGGGGQGGGAVDGTNGGDGARGGGDGGSGGSVLGGPGGNGAEGAANGGAGTFSPVGAAGGGGGGVGRVRFNVVLGCSLGPAGTPGVTLSPRPTTNLTDGGCQ